MANSSELYDTKIPEKFRGLGIGMYFTTPDRIKIEISKTSGYHSFSTKWRDSTVFYWTFEISVRTKEREIIFEKTFPDSRKMSREGFRYDSSVCKYLDDFLNKVGVPVLVAREEQAMREWKEREAKAARGGERESASAAIREGQVLEWLTKHESSGI